MSQKFVQGQKYRLSGSGITATDTSITLQSFQTPDGTNITTALLGTTNYGTLEPGTSKEEIISFTGVTQNASGTATLTGVTRGLLFTTPYTADSSLRQAHAGGAVFIISNNPQMYEDLTSFNNDETITGEWTFTNTKMPKLDSYAAPTDDEQFATKKYIDDVAIAGSPDATETVKGISEIATEAEIDADTATGGTGAKLVMSPDRLATSKYGTRLPSADEKDALAGTSGTPSSTNKYVTDDDTTGTGDVVRENLLGNIYGDGSDGDVTISSNTTLTRDMYYDNLTINSGVTLSPSGYRIYVKGTLTNNGIIDISGGDGNDGGDAVFDSNVGAGGAGGGKNASDGTLYGGADGGSGGNGGTSTGDAGTDGTDLTRGIGAFSISADGGAGGNTPANSGGAGGQNGAITDKFMYRDLHQLLLLRDFNLTAPFIVNGSPSNGGGGGGSSNTSTNNRGFGGGGGGAGASGGNMFLVFSNLINNGTISANGGDGGDGGDAAANGGNTSPDASGGGGGAGGNGGVIILYGTISTLGTVSVSGGTGGAGGQGLLSLGVSNGQGDDGGSGGNGSDGEIYNFQLN